MLRLILQKNLLSSTTKISPLFACVRNFGSVGTYESQTLKEVHSAIGGQYGIVPCGAVCVTGMFGLGIGVSSLIENWSHLSLNLPTAFSIGQLLFCGAVSLWFSNEFDRSVMISTSPLIRKVSDFNSHPRTFEEWKLLDQCLDKLYNIGVISNKKRLILAELLNKEVKRLNS